MMDEAQAAAASALDEGAWIYMISPSARRPGDDAVRERIVETCEAGGWPTVSWSPTDAERSSGDPGPLFEGIRHAVEHADCVVALLGGTGETADAELALAYSHRRPIIGMRLSGDEFAASPVEAMLERYERARVISCDDAEGCATALHAVFSDPEFTATIHQAASEQVSGA